MPPDQPHGRSQNVTHRVMGGMYVNWLRMHVVCTTVPFWSQYRRVEKERGEPEEASEVRGLRELLRGLRGEDRQDDDG
ncbi:hypothetical protein SUGI_0914650 [Cryptomeria japonica]|nr:hypothetical protein SUGI_0914650 [Cryptomeria japonica]